MIEGTRQAVRSSHLRPGVKSKESTKFIESIVKHLDQRELVKELTQRMAEV
jgi:hypothetical protein